MLWTKNEIIAALGSDLLQHNLSAEIAIDEVVIDSRRATKNTLFFALKGDNNDGHNFLDQVFNNGCEASIIDNVEAFQKFSNHGLFLVKNTFSALYKLAEFSRQKSSAKIIGVTGSVGKTGVKEMLKTSFAKQGKTYATSGNLNNHIGLPLTLCNMPSDSQFAIIEMGMNHLHEIEALSKLARPHIAVITTIAPAHIGNFNNEEEIALAKSEIFSGLEPQGFAILNRDNKYYHFLENRAKISGIQDKNILSFGENLASDYQLTKLEIQGHELSLVKAKTKNHGEISYKISSAHKATIFNSLIVLACLDLTSHNITNSLDTLKNLSASKGRGEIIAKKVDGKNIVIIDDSYNANVSSMKAGIEYLADLKTALNKNRSIAILGDMFELGDKAAPLHEETLQFLQEFHIDLALLAGESMKKATKVLDKKNYKTYLNAAALALEIKDFLQDGDILLIKGSRGMKMEKIIENL